MSVPLALVAAIGQNGVIGADDRLPFRLPSDLKRFRALTWGKPLLMGRKTFESIGRPLPGRETIIVTRGLEFSVAASGVHVAYDLDEALALAQRRAEAMGADEVILAGGGDLYGALLAHVDRMYLTLVDLAPPGDVRFPHIDWSEWVERARIRPPPHPADEASFAFVEFQRLQLARDR
ncbi:Dihydrofolate reductase type 3 [Methylocella tundrae]|uniref:Dihydrofolate reductase n=1 Tax=Methylocella tundrae TaxID=227605 RepID=A0A8B6MBP3_METTU|nr:dihydrofolate reductase [Methylocella tundrae]VTZ52334.1 Dihydrofolate reductase type 3 [Methylocella tundrae]